MVVPTGCHDGRAAMQQEAARTNRTEMNAGVHDLRQLPVHCVELTTHRGTINNV